MQFLVLNDFNSKINRDNFDVVTGSDYSTVIHTEAETINEIESYLSGRYDVSKIFIYHTPFLAGESYPKGTLLYLTAPEYGVGKTYAPNDLVLEASTKKIFKALQAGTGQPLSNATYWLNIGNDNSFYEQLTDATGEILTNTADFKAGDPRNPIIKRYTVDIVLYELHCRINPRNIPEFRVERRDDAVEWLKLVQNPRNNVNADFLPARDFGERKGNDISWNSRPKQSNKY